MFDWRFLTGPLALQDDGPLILAPDQERAVTRLWDQALLAKPEMFDGPIITVERIEIAKLIVRRAHYRHAVAARQATEIALRPLAVSGLLSCPDGVVFGRRAAFVSQGAGQWELVPSGGAETLDLKRQILLELEEEIGLASHQVTVGQPTALLIGKDCVDAVIPLVTDLSADALAACHAARGSREYDRLLVTSSPHDFIAGRKDVLAASRLIVEHLLRK